MDYFEYTPEEDIPDNMCAICLENIDQNVRELIWKCNNCNKELHKDCMDNWHKNCPYCRIKINYPLVPNNSTNIITIISPTRNIRIEDYDCHNLGTIMGCIICIILSIVFCLGCYLLINLDIFRHRYYNRTLLFDNEKK